MNCVSRASMCASLATSQGKKRDYAEAPTFHTFSQTWHSLPFGLKTSPPAQGRYSKCAYLATVKGFGLCESLWQHMHRLRFAPSAEALVPADADCAPRPRRASKPAWLVALLLILPHDLEQHSTKNKYGNIGPAAATECGVAAPVAIVTRACKRLHRGR